MSKLIGQLLGRYHILEQLGEGGMATVYKAYDAKLERDVAIKVIRADQFGSAHLGAMLKRFEREAKSLAKLSHPNILKVLDYGEHEDSPFLVMEYLPGGTLKQRVGKPIPWPEAARLLLPIAQALEYAHEHDLIHRDIKPSNILLTEKGQPMLTDFGIAKILTSDDSATLTGTGVGIGTPEYMAPEQWTGQATKQSDIYSLGVVFYEMVTGNKPYTADTPAAVLLKQANDPLPRPTQFAPDLPEAVEKVLIKALAKKTEVRYQSAAEFTHALETLFSGAPTAAKPQPPQAEVAPQRKPAPPAAPKEEPTVEEVPAQRSYGTPVPTPKPTPAPSGLRRFWPLAVGGVLVICAVVVALIVLLVQRLNQEVPASTNVPAGTAPVEIEPTNTKPAEVAPTPSAPFEGKILAAPYCGNDYSGLFESIEATDRYQVTFRLCRPDPAFLSKIAFNVFAIYPSEWIESTAGAGNRATEGLEHPVGSGPYMVGEWRRGESITLVANPDYWGQPPAAQTLVFRWSSESSARLLELQAGTIDGFDNVGPEDFDTVRRDANLLIVTRPALNVFYIGITNTFAPFDNILVRQALAMGIDRQRIVDNFYPPGSEVATHFTPCSIPNGCAGDPWYDFDPVAARDLLAKAGYPNGFSTKLYYRDVVRGYLPQVGNMAQEIQAQLRENLGIRADIVVMESGAFIEASTSGSLDGLYFLGWIADYPHVTNFLDYHFGEQNPQFGVQSDSYTSLLVEAAQIADPNAAEPIYARINNAIRDYVPMIPVAHGASAVAYRTDVINPQASPLGAELFYVANPGGRDIFVFMQNAEPISLFCADESDGESLRVCEQVTESLYAYEINGTAVKPALAESCAPNGDLTVWVCNLRQGVKFHDGSDFDANDVVTTFIMGLDASSPLHVGNTNLWEYYD
ncbi:MAG: ABC transporter substrate-binding protein, partial [Chloroflexota bacterium]